MKKFFQIVFLTWGFFLFSSQFVFAHEAYVLTRSEFQQGLMAFSTNPLGPLLAQHYMQISTLITICVIAAYVCNFLWATTKIAAALDKIIKKARVIGPLVIRLAISSSFFYAAYANAILGPELSLTNVAGGSVIRFFLFLLSLL